MAKNKGLGRGLDALLDELDAPQPEQQGQIELDLYDIDTNPHQPRKTFDPEKLSELAASIRRHGVVQPILVRKNGARYTIVAGERRYRAARQAGLMRVPAVITDVDEDALMEISLVENIQRENLNPIEEAAALKLLMDQHDLTQEEVSERVGKSRPAIANALRLLTLAKSVQKLIKDGRLSAGHGKMLAGVGDVKLQMELAEKCVDGDWSVRRLEDELRFAEMPKKKKKQRPEPSPEFRSALHRMRAELGTKVAVQGTEDKGKLVIHYYSREDLDRIYRTIVGND
ncbi:MAG: ParB/RepB/Spo0J family partition protein [Clostridia bacterium]|jgi:ParB family chromosome partitioning protein|nr:ParB/RepB/Spo0J family partition protein [Clostridia bacterium]